jgi:hypothetical protein
VANRDATRVVPCRRRVDQLALGLQSGLTARALRSPQFFPRQGRRRIRPALLSFRAQGFFREVIGGDKLSIKKLDD